MKQSMVELPSGRMVNLENVIYLSDIKEKSSWFTDWAYEYSFDIIWAGGERITLKFDNKENCILEWENLKLLLKNHTESLICD